MKTSTIFEQTLTFNPADFEIDEYAERRSKKAASRNKTRSHQAVRSEKYYVSVSDLENI